MEARPSKKGYYPFLDGLKGITCASVFLGHYFIAFCVKDIFPVNSPVYRAGEFIFQGSFAVSLFCVISGFLAAHKSLNTIREFLSCCIKRFLRFEIPLLIVIAGVMFLNGRGLFSCCEPLADILENKRIQGQFVYKTNYLSLFQKPFWSFWQYDNPLWMICQLFAGGIVIYMRSYVLTLFARRLSAQQMKAIRILSFVVIASCGIIDTTMFAVVLGGGLQELSQKLSTLPASKKTCIKSLSVLLAISALIASIYLYFFKDFDYLHLGREYTWAGLAGALTCFCLLLSHARLKSFFSGKPFRLLGKISFGIYVLHYPLLGTVSCRLIYCFANNLGYAKIVIIAFALTSLSVLTAATAYRYLIELPAYWLINRLPSGRQSPSQSSAQSRDRDKPKIPDRREETASETATTSSLGI